MKINYMKVYTAIQLNDKLPRKVKKAVLGKRMSTGKLKKLLKTVEVVSLAKTMYEDPIIKPYLFCPKCGCTKVRSTGNMTSYPEHWENFYCVRCNNHVAYIDNSPFTHCLEFGEDENFTL